MFLASNDSLIFLTLAILTVFVILCFILCMVNMSKLHRVQDLTEESELADLVREYFSRVEALSQEIETTSDSAILAQLRECSNQSAAAMKRVGVQNFNAYDDVTGNFSFSLAVLNGLNDGFILTSLYGHNSCNTYIREVKNGVSQTFLLEEEKQALSKAING